MRLLYLPNELQDVVLKHLTQKSIGQLCLMCKSSYQLYLPALYHHVELGHRTQIKQLESGLETNAFLKETTTKYTQILTLKCRQGGSSHLVSLFRQLPNIRQLHFRDFLALSINKVRQLVFTLPRLTLLDFQYCELISSDNVITKNDSDDKRTMENKTHSSSSSNNKRRVTYHPHLQSLQLMWTDFSREAIRQLFHTAPNITMILLGANHNRTPTANDAALQLLKKYCHSIKHLSISLQQIKEASLCDLVREYNTQLETLSIRCGDGDHTLTTISNYATNIKHLTIRRSHQTDLNVIMVVLLQKCRRLTRLEMVSWPIQDVPTVVLDQIRRQPNRLEDVKKRTVSLGRQDLQEIRRICID
ncbi:hypothetical protein K501DRAFT_244933 [Backusella circina FSU 941]|nr:hypothetical protein K501DRAFT_244933 [Backusella circina FSU 941]